MNRNEAITEAIKTLELEIDRIEAEALTIVSRADTMLGSHIAYRKRRAIEVLKGMRDEHNQTKGE